MRVCAKGMWPWARMQYILVINKEQGKLREGLNCSLEESIQELGDLFGEGGVRGPINDRGEEVGDATF